MNFRSRIWVVFAVLGFFGHPARAEIFAASEHCVAWKTKKTMALIRVIEPSGKNCGIEVEMEALGSELFRVRGSFPIDHFHSDESDRDKEVIHILKGEKQMNLIFMSQAKSRQEWREILKTKTTILDGSLNIGGQDFPLQVELKIDESEDGFVVKGQHISKFKNFSISPPKVVGGLIARVHDYLELHFQFQSAKIKNLATVVQP